MTDEVFCMMLGGRIRTALARVAHAFVPDNRTGPSLTLKSACSRGTARATVSPGDGARVTSCWRGRQESNLHLRAQSPRSDHLSYAHRIAGLSRLPSVALRTSRLYVFAALSESSFSGVRVPATSRLGVCGVA